MLETTFVALRDRSRLLDISRVLIRYGLDDIVDRLGLRQLPGLRNTDPDHALRHATAPERLRHALEALGPTFIKLGQILSTRADLLSPAWTQELEKLQSAVAPLPWETLRAQITEDLGDDPARIFAYIDPTPLAAASIAQVYRATLPDGTEVVLKVRRPGLEQIVRADLRLLAHMGALLEQQWPDIAHLRPNDILRQLSRAIIDELDFTHEGHHSETVAQHFADDPDIVIARVHWAWSSARLLVQDFVPGIAASDIDRIRAAGLDGATLARHGARAFLQMVLDDGIFHADPHPGNLMALAGNRVAFIDWGMVGQLSERRQEQVLVLLRAIVQRDPRGVSAVLLDWVDATQPDLSRLDAAAEDFVARQGTGPLLSIGKALTDFMAIARSNAIRVPTDLTLLFKALITADGVLKRLDPAFDIVAVTAPIVQRAMQRRYAPRALRRRGLLLAGDFYELAGEAPHFLRILMHRLKQGRISASIEVANMDRMARALERSATRLAIAVVTAAFALGLAPTLIATSPQWREMPIFALLGGVVTVVGIVLLVLSLRRRR